MNQSKIVATLGLLVIGLVLLVGLSLNSDDGVAGILTETIGKMIRMVAGERVVTEPEYRQIGLFDIYESKLRSLLHGLTVLVALLTGILAVIAAREDSDSLWYSIGVFAAGSAIAEIALSIGIAYLIIFGFLVSRSRSWKMTST